jgi:hypothetical protein
MSATSRSRDGYHLFHDATTGSIFQVGLAADGQSQQFIRSASGVAGCAPSGTLA